MIVTPECASAHIRGRYKSKRMLRSRIRRRRRSGMTSSRRAASAVQDGMARLAKHASKHPAFNDRRHRDRRPERALAQVCRYRFRFCAGRANARPVAVSPALAHHTKVIRLFVPQACAAGRLDYSKKPNNLGCRKMQLKIAIVLSAAAFLFSIAGAEAVPLSGSNGIPAIQSEAVNVQCAHGRRCVGGWGWNGPRRFCRRWTVCR